MSNMVMGQDTRIRKRIAIVANSSWNIYQFRLNVIDKFLEMGLEVFVLAPVDEYIEYRERYPDIKHIPLRFLDRKSTGIFRNVLLIEELRRKYKRLQPDLILHYTHKANIFGSIAAKMNGIPSVAVVTGLGYSFLHTGLVQNFTKWLYRFTKSFHQKVIFENIADRELFEKEGMIKKNQGVSIKGCGLDIEYFHPNGQTKKGEKLVFTFIGRLLYDKGIREFAEAAKSIRSSTRDVEFWVVGELDEENPSTLKKEELVQWVDDKIIIYHGFKKDVRSIIHRSDCIVLPSYREAIPRSITEAMAMAKPVITTNTAGCEEAVDQSENGFLVKPKNVESLVKAVYEMIQIGADGRREMGQKGRKKAVKEFDDKKIANDIYRIVQPLIPTG